MTQLSLPLQFKNIVGLGQPVKSYAHSKLSKIGNVIGCIICLAIGIYLIIEGLVLYPQRYPDVAESNSPIIIGVGVAFLLGTIFWVWRLITKWNEMLVVYDSGFAYFNGKEMSTFKWEEISTITMRVIKQTVYGVIPAGTQRKYWIHNVSGEELKLDGSLSEPDDFINRVREGANPYIFARKKEHFDTGEPLDFGAIAISTSKGIIKGKNNYPWSDIGQIGLNQGTLWVVPKEKGAFRKFSVPVIGMPNFDILMALSAEMAEKYK